MYIYAHTSFMRESGTDIKLAPLPFKKKRIKSLDYSSFSRETFIYGVKIRKNYRAERNRV